MNEISPGGSEILRHKVADGPTDVPEYDEGLRAAIEAHLAKFLPGEPGVLHEIESEGIHLDVYVYPPSDQRPIWTLVTMGMSERAMNVPEGAEEWRRCELISTLPADWSVPDDPDEFRRFFSDDANYWPIKTLKDAARLPYQYNTWLAYGHTLAADSDPQVTYPGSPYAGMLIAYPLSLPPESGMVEYNGKQIYFWGVFPLYGPERDFKLQEGADALLDVFIDSDIHEGVYRDRPILVKRAN